MNVDPALEQLAVNTIRGLAMDGVQQANSGHPGAPMGMADVAYVLWMEFLQHDPQEPEWNNRDRFVLSAGHGSMLLYSLLHLFGYPMPLDELKRFRQWGSATPGLETVSVWRSPSVCWRLGSATLSTTVPTRLSATAIVWKGWLPKPRRSRAIWLSAGSYTSMIITTLPSRAKPI